VVENSESREGRYANYFEIRCTASEIIVDFGQHYEERREPLSHSTIIMSPASAKVFLDMLKDVVGRYEANVSPMQRSEPTAREDP
jgi:hypothetical protein